MTRFLRERLTGKKKKNHLTKSLSRVNQPAGHILVNKPITLMEIFPFCLYPCRACAAVLKSQSYTLVKNIRSNRDTICRVLDSTTSRGHILFYTPVLTAVYNILLFKPIVHGNDHFFFFFFVIHRGS